MKTLYVLVGAFFLACSGTDADFGDDFEGDEFDALEQPMSAPKTQNYQPGFNQSATHMACTSAGGQTCMLPNPSNKTVGVCFAAGISTTQKGYIRDGIARVDNATNWTFSELESVCELTYEGGLNYGADETSLNIHDYRRFSDNLLTTSLTESVPNSYRSFTTGTCRIDTADAAQAQNGTRQSEILRHIGGQCAGFMVGLGVRTDSFPAAASGTVMDQSLSPFTAHLGLTAGEACRASGITLGGPGTLTVTNCQTSD